MKIVKDCGLNLAFRALASAFIAGLSMVLWKPAPAPAAWAGAAVRLGAALPPAAAVLQDTAQEKEEDDEEKKGLPLEPTRTLRFTADRGTWMSLDVSPDGSRIVFDHLGDLYLLPIGGGEADRLTEGLAFDAQPRFSPDGSRVVFVSDRSGGENIWVISVDGRDTLQITKGKANEYASPEWTPDGGYIVASRIDGLFGPAKLWLYHVDGGTGTALVKEPEELKTLGATFGPDERYIWFAERTGNWQYNAIFPQYQLAVYDRETGRRTTMSARYGSAFRPAISPDGRWLVYGSRHDEHTGLRIRDTESGEERWLAYPVQRDDQESRASLDVLPGYAFAPDSREVVVSYGGRIWRVPVDGAEATEVPFRIEVDLPLGPEVRFAYRIEDAPTFTVRQIRDAVPSPGGDRLAFVVLDHLRVMDYPDGDPVRLTDLEVGEFEPAWSPDGRWIAFVTWSDTAGGHIYRVRADGDGPAERLTGVSGYYRQPAWSPDGSRIVAVRSAARDMQEARGFFRGGLGEEFVWVPATGGDLQLVAPAGDRSAPHFSGSSDRIYAFSRSEGLVSFRWDGTDEKQHLKVVGAKLPGAEEPMRASLVLLSPAGGKALAAVVNDLYVVTVPYVGGETPSVSVAKPEEAAFPVRKLTDVGGGFPAWGDDGRTVHWTIGNAHFVYDLERAKVFEDSVKAVKKAEASAKEEAPDEGEAEADEGEDEGEAEADAGEGQGEEEEEPRYEPAERRIEITAQRDLPRGTVVLRGGRAVTMVGDQIIEDAAIVVRDSRIERVAPSAEVETPSDAREIDVTGTTIIPGFVDTHYHAQWLVAGIHNTRVWQYPANLAYGVTTTRDPQTSTTDILTYSDRVETGDLIGPRIYSTGPGVFISEQIRDLDHARDVLRRYSDYYDTKTFKMYMSGNRQQRQWLIMAARELELMPTTEGGLDFPLNLTHAIDGYSGLEHSLPILPIYEDVIELFVETGITHTPTLLVSYGGPFGENFYYATEPVHDDAKLRRFTPHAEIDAKSRRRGSSQGGAGWFMEEEYVFEQHARFAKELIEAGGRVGVGSHGQLQGLGYHWELWSLQSGGMSEHNALRAATILGAEAIGFGHDIGSLETGKLADLIVFDANPLDAIRNTAQIRYVMKNGRLYDGETLDEVYPRERPFPPLRWADREPDVAAGMR